MADDKKPRASSRSPRARRRGKAEKAGKGDKGGEAQVESKPRRRRSSRRRGRRAALHEKYKAEVIPALTKQFSYKNPNQVPRLQKIVVNMGLGAAVANPKIIDTAVEELKAITGQKPIVTRSKKAIANFKLRAGSPSARWSRSAAPACGSSSTASSRVALPRTRDFKGVSRKAFDGKGNYTLGLASRSSSPRSTTTRSTQSRA
jgi:large subunit ribosomal protein L5